MELCNGGDLETHISNLPNKQLPIKIVGNIFLQMCFALHTVQDRLKLRHYDLKLLNWFGELSGVDTNCLHYHHSGLSFQCLLADPGNLVVKLADLGTVDCCASTLNEPINTRQFTTWENVPVRLRCCFLLI